MNYLLLCFTFVFSFHLSAITTEGDHCRPFFVMSPPKCGTHLIGKALELILNKSPAYNLADLGTFDEAVHYVQSEFNSGNFAVAHNFSKNCVDRLTSNGYVVIFIMRDPRDQLISVQNWLREGQWSWIPTSKIKNTKAQLRDLITGSKKKWKCVDSCFLTFYNIVQTLPNDRVYYVRFENLVGSQGGGDDALQLQEVLNLATFLGVPLSFEQAESVCSQLFGGTRTFRQGHVGAWKKHFSKGDIKAFQSRYNSLLIRLGYTP